MRITFCSASTRQIAGIPVGSLSQTLSANDTFSGEDLTFSGSDVLVRTTERLFLRLEITAATPLPAPAGDQFTIALSDLLFLTRRDRSPASRARREE